jgi:hypothetical protein
MNAVDISADGRVVATWDAYSDNGDVYIYNTETEALDYVTSTGSFLHQLRGMSADGQHLIGTHGDPMQAGIFHLAKGTWADLGSPYGEGCDGAISSGWELNADGSVAVGLVYNTCSTTYGYQWSAYNGFTVMQYLGQGYNRATVVSDDGSILAGFAQGLYNRTPAIWNADGTGQLIDPTEELVGEFQAMSPDGSVLAGQHAPPDAFNQQQMYYTAEEGIVDIGLLPNSTEFDSGFVYGVCADGELIIGSSGDPFWGVQYATAYTKDGGIRKLQDIVEENGLTLPEGHHMSHGGRCSNDGTRIIGSITTDMFELKTFVLTLPIEAYGLASPE